jgi:extracellular elastinolytic metalloproteinase
MRRSLTLIALVAVTATVGASAGGAQPDRDPLAIALDYIRDNRAQLGLTAADISDKVVTDQYSDAHTGVTHIYLQQRFKGIGVHNGLINVHVTQDGSVLTVGNRFVSDLVPKVNRETPGRAARQAVEDAARGVELALGREPTVLSRPGGPAQEVIFDDAGVSQRPIPAKLVYQPLESGAVRLAWNVEIYERDAEHWWSVNVDAATGEVLLRDDYVDDASYRVFALPKESPSDGARTLETDPHDAAASPFGWHDLNGVAGADTTITNGNNVSAYTDTDANNVPDPLSQPDGGLGLVFDFPFDPSQQPTDYRPAAVTNLFYWNNIVHDVAYRYGFTEAAGNFQVNNYGRGGLGADAVNAEAQDGSAQNNANFATPRDGLQPRMQMFVWTPPAKVTVNSPASIAGDYDAGTAAFGPQLTATGLTGDVVLGLDEANPTGPTTTDACTALTNPAEVSGKIALVDRGTCTFVVKVKNAQNAGAIAVIVADNAPGPAAGMAGTDATITIPSVRVTQADGNTFKANLPVNATLRRFGSINRDSDLDAGVIAHEYGHGISNRLTGGPANVSCLNNEEQMGEGWSDYIGLVLTAVPADAATTNRGIGSYVSFQAADGPGIRPTPYTTDMDVNFSTYDTIKQSNVTVPHGVGWVWASMLWEVYWNLVGEHGFNPNIYGAWQTGGNNLAFQLVMDGMKLQPCSPGFVDGRDAILRADQALTGGENQCLIWGGFAKRGLGASARQGSSGSRSDGTQAFDVPAACAAQIEVTPASLSSNLVRGNQETKSLTIANTASARGAASLSWSVSEAQSNCSTPSDLPWVSASPANGTTSPGSTSTVGVTFDSGAAAPGVHNGVLCITSNDPDSSPRLIPLTLDVDYAFSGFFGSVANPPAVNSVKAGNTVAITFSLAGNWGLNIFAVGFPKSQQVNCTTLAPIGNAAGTKTPRGQSLTYSAATDRYSYPWATDRKWRGTCRDFQLGLNDGTTRRAYFGFTN